MTKGRGGHYGNKGSPGRPALSKGPARAKRIEDKWRAWGMLIRGMHFRDIARILECSLGKACNLITEARAEVAAQTRDDAIVEMNERHRLIIATHMPHRRDPESAKVVQGSDKLRMGLLGLEAPRRTELTGKDGGPIALTHEAEDELLDRLNRLAGAAGKSEDPEGSES